MGNPMCVWVGGSIHPKLVKETEKKHHQLNENGISPQPTHWHVQRIDVCTWNGHMVCKSI